METSSEAVGRLLEGKQERGPGKGTGGKVVLRDRGVTEGVPGLTLEGPHDLAEGWFASGGSRRQLCGPNRHGRAGVGGVAGTGVGHPCSFAL